MFRDRDTASGQCIIAQLGPWPGNSEMVLDGGVGLTYTKPWFDP